MTIEQFWFGEIDLLKVYQIQYIRDKSYTAWINGQFSMVGNGLALSNSFAKKGTKPKEYPNWQDPIKRIYKPKLSKEQLEIKFRQQQIEQNNWLFGKK